MSRAIVRIEDMGGSHPVQAEGHMLIGDAAYPFYFRFRGDRAQMTVWQPGAPHRTSSTAANWRTLVAPV